MLLSEEVRTQLEGVQQRLSAVREEVIENSISREKESFNARRAQVRNQRFNGVDLHSVCHLWIEVSIL